MRCPNCQSEIAFDDEMFRGTPCPACRTRVEVSNRYVNTVAVICFIAAEGLLWVLQVRRILYPIVGFDLGLVASLWLGFLVGMMLTLIALQFMPEVIQPKLVLRNFEGFVSLDLDKD